ncbi:MAG: DUF1254 domain-containing protein [Bacteroidales bacterium]
MILIAILSILPGFIIGLVVSVYRFPQKEVLRLYRIFNKNRLNLNSYWMHYRNVMDHTSRLIVKPNCETLYSTSFIELDKCSYQLKIPEVKDYFSVAFLNKNTEVLGYITNKELNKAGETYFILSNKKKNHLNNKYLFLDTSLCWIIVRFGFSSTEAIKNVNKLQDQIGLIPI